MRSRYIVFGFIFSLYLSTIAQDTVIQQAADTITNRTTSITTSDTTLNQDDVLDKEPQLLKFVKAVIPPELSRKGITGSVMLDLLVDSLGKVDSIYVTRGIHPQIDTAVVQAVKQFTFSPAEEAGAAVAVIISYQYNITLDEQISTVEEYVNFSGTVFERGTRNPVRDAMIVAVFPDTTSDTTLKVPFGTYLQKIGSFKNQSFSDNAIITQTDSAGKFSFKSLPVGPVHIKISNPSFEPYSTSDTVYVNQVTDVTYRIQKTDYADYEIVVYGKAEPKEVARRTLTVKEIRKIPGFSGDAVKVVQALPGVARSSFGGGAIVVRGAPTWDSKFYIDGIEIPQLYHFGGLKSTYNSDALESVDFYPGGFGVRYGSTIAGVIELKGKDANREKLKGFADVNLLDATAFVESPLGKKGGIIATARRSYFGDILRYVSEKDFFNIPITVMPFYYDYLVRGDYSFTPEQKAHISLFGSKDKLELIAPFVRGGSKEIDNLADRIKQEVRFNMVTGGFDSKFSSKLSNSLKFGVVKQNQNGSIFGRIKFESDSWEYSLRDELALKLSDKLQFTGGFFTWFQNSEINTILPSDRDNTFTYDTSKFHLGLAAAYIDCQYRPIPKLLLIPGLRFDYYKELSYNGGIVPEFWNYHFNNSRGISGEPSLRLTARYILTKNHTLKAAIGNYNQTPQPSIVALNDIFGNPYLPASKARHIVVGHEWQINDVISSDIQVYHNQQWDIPDPYTKEELAIKSDMMQFNPDGKDRMYGFELMLKHDQNERLFGWIAYTLARSEKYNRDLKKWELYDKDQTHNLQLVLNYRFKKQWEAGTRIRYVSGNPYTPVEFSENDVTNRLHDPHMGPKNSLRNDPFFQVDVRVDKKIIFDKWSLSMYLDLQNISYPIYKSPEFTLFNFDYKSSAVINAPFIPSLGVRADF